MKIAFNDKAVVLYFDNPKELQQVAQQLAACTGLFPIPAIISDGNHTIRVHSLKNFVATIRLENVERDK